MADLEEILSSLHDALAEDLLTRIIKGDATASDLSVARQFLKDNGISGLPTKGNPLGELADKMEDLPDFSEEDNVVNMGPRS